MRKIRSNASQSEMPELNLTPMIDVVFQLIIFFMCAMKFKTLAMKIEMELPKSYGIRDTSEPMREDVPVRVTVLQASSEGVAHVSVFGEELRPDLGRGVGPLPRIPNGDGEQDAAAAALARHEAAWAEHFTPKLAALKTRLENYRRTDPTLRYEVEAGPTVRHAYVVGVLDAFLDAGIEQVDIRGTKGPGPGR